MFQRRVIRCLAGAGWRKTSTKKNVVARDMVACVWLVFKTLYKSTNTNCKSYMRGADMCTSKDDSYIRFRAQYNFACVLLFPTVRSIQRTEQVTCTFPNSSSDRIQFINQLRLCTVGCASMFQQVMYWPNIQSLCHVDFDAMLQPIFSSFSFYL